VKGELIWEPVSGFEPLACCLQVGGVVQVRKHLRCWRRLRRCVTVRRCPAPGLHCWLHEVDEAGVSLWRRFCYDLGLTTLVTTQRCLPILRSRTNPSFS
jgi:hypothetical protein